MKKFMSAILMSCLLLSSNSVFANEVAEMINLESRELFFKDLNDKLDQSQELIRKELKKSSDKEIEKKFSSVVTLFKEKQEDVLFELGLDHSSTTREVLERMSEDDAQLVMNQMIEAKIDAVGGFDNFKSSIESNEKGIFKVFKKILMTIGNVAKNVFFFVFIYPIVVFMLITGIWSI